MKEKFVPPKFQSSAFHCPHCEVYAHQHWFLVYKMTSTGRLAGELEEFKVGMCERCEQHTLWLNDKMIYPTSSIAPLPVENMPPNVAEDYNEARNIASFSPRASAALLRLALQKLVIHLGEKGKDLNEAIGNLVKIGLPTTIQQALDCVRVIGNNAVHPGELDLKDDKETAIALFGLVNMIVNVMITQPKEVKELYDKIPKGAKNAIAKRDK